MVADGRLSFRDYARVKSAKQLYELTVAKTAQIDNLENYWFYGPTGTGKSKRVRDTWGADLYIKNPNKWWDGYTG